MFTTASPTFCTTRTIGVMRMSSGGMLGAAVVGFVPRERAVANREQPTSITATGRAVRHRSIRADLIVDSGAEPPRRRRPDRGLGLYTPTGRRVLREELGPSSSQQRTRAIGVRPNRRDGGGKWAMLDLNQRPPAC